MQHMLDLFMYALTTNSILWVGLIFVLGLLVGSFLNVVIHRVPIMLERDWRTQARQILEDSAEAADGKAGPTHRSAHQSAHRPATPADTAPPSPDVYNLAVPRSACPGCGALITAWQNIPVVSYLVLKGRCANCGVKIPPRYPVVEFATALLSALVAWKFGVVWYTAAALVLTWSLIALSGIDIDHQLLPDNITLPLMWLGLLLSLAATIPQAGLPVDPRSSIIGAAAGYLSLWSLFHLFKLLTGKEGMGYGDFKLFAALGAWLGWQMLLLIILLSAFTGALVGIAMIALRGRDKNIPIPFGPYLAAAGWIALMWGHELIGSYLRISGIGT